MLDKLRMCKRPIFYKTQFYVLVYFISIASMFVPNLEPIGSSSGIRTRNTIFFLNGKRPMPYITWVILLRNLECWKTRLLTWCSSLAFHNYVRCNITRMLFKGIKLRPLRVLPYYPQTYPVISLRLPLEFGQLNSKLGFFNTC